MAKGAEVVTMVDALVALPDPSPESVGSILGVTLTPGRLSEVFDGMFAEGPFGKAQLRYYKDVSAGTLSLDARPDSGLVAANIDLREYGPPPPGPTYRARRTLAAARVTIHWALRAREASRSTFSSLSRRSDSTRS